MKKPAKSNHNILWADSLFPTLYDTLMSSRLAPLTTGCIRWEVTFHFQFLAVSASTRSIKKQGLDIKLKKK